MSAQRVLELVDAPEQGAGTEDNLQQCIQRPHHHDDRQPIEGDASPLLVCNGSRSQPQERQVAQVHQRFLERTGAIHGIEGRDQLRQPIGKEQDAGQCPGWTTEQARASPEPHQQQAQDCRQCAQHHHAFGNARRRPQGNEGQHPRRCPAPTMRRSFGISVGSGGDRRHRQVLGKGPAWHPAWPAGCRAS